MKRIAFWGAVLGIGVLLVGCITGCSGARSAAQEPMQSPLATVERAALAIDIGWGYPNATPLPYQGIGLGVPRQVGWAMENIPSMESLFPIGLNGDTLIAAAIFAEHPEATSEEVNPLRGGMVTVNLSTGQVRVLSDGFSTEARTDGRYVVWTESDTTNGRYITAVHVYDLEQNRESVLEGDACHLPDVSNGIVVWSEPRDGGWGIYGYNLVTQSPITVASGPGSRSFPRISGNWAIYLELGDKSAVLQAYSVETGEHLRLGVTPYYNNANDGRYHAIESGRAVWVDAETHQIHLYDLGARQERVLALPTRGAPVGLALTDNVLLFTSEQPMGYDLSRDILFSVPLVPPGEREGFVTHGIIASGDRLAWVIRVGGLEGEQRLYTAPIVRPGH